MNFDGNVLQVAIEDIIPNRFQPRLAFEDTSLQELANSIKQHGIIQPLVLRRVGEKFEIIAGERRYKAATMAGLTSVPAVISQVDDKTSAEVAVVENVQRKDLTAIEEAKSYKALLDQGFMSQDQLAKRMGLSQAAVSNKLRLLTLPEDVQIAVMENRISERHARSLLAVKSPDEQLRFLERIISERLTVRQLDEIIRDEYDESGSAKEINIDEIKQNATDIKPMNIELPIDKPKEKQPFTMGAINLGQKTQNKFFNTLEDEAANLEMTEAINPFSQLNNTPSPTVKKEEEKSVDEGPKPAPMPIFDDAPIVSLDAPVVEIKEEKSSPIEGLEMPAKIAPEPSASVEVDTLDSLDFEPPKVEKDVTKAVDEVQNMVNKLRMDNFNVESLKTDLLDQVTITITIKKEEN